MKENTSIKWIKILAITQIVLMLIFIGILFWLYANNPETENWNEVIELLTQNEKTSLTIETAVNLSAIPFIVIIASLMSLEAIKRRTIGFYKFTIAVLIFDIIMSLGPISVIMLILFLSKGGRNFFGLK